MALCVQCYLLMDRVDRAEAQAKAMSAADDDATASQLAAAWVGAELGGAKVQEACYIYQELGDKYTWTVRGDVEEDRRGVTGHQAERHPMGVRPSCRRHRRRRR